MKRVEATKVSVSTSVAPEIAAKLLQLTIDLKQTKSKLMYGLLLVGLDHLDDLSNKIKTLQ